MKKKILSIVLSFSMIFSTTGFAFADADLDSPPAEPTKVEKEAEEPSQKEVEKEEVKEEPPKEEIKEEEPKEELKEEPTEVKKEDNTQENLQIKEETPIVKKEVKSINQKASTVEMSITFKYRDSKNKAEWTTKTLTNTASSWNVLIAKGNNIIANHKTCVNGSVEYTFKSWDTEFPVHLDAETPQKTITAQYNTKNIYNLDFYYNDDVGNGTGSWSSKNGFSGYTHTFPEPADYSKPQYNFLYWEDTINKEKKESGESKTIEAEDLTTDTTINYQATYEYQPALRVVYHYEDGATDEVGDNFEPIDIYGEAPIKGLSWYYNIEDEEPIVEGTEAELEEKVITTEELDNITVVDVYAKSIEGTVVPGGAEPEPEPTQEPDVVTPNTTEPESIAPTSNNTLVASVSNPKQTKATKKKTQNTEEIIYGLGDGYTPKQNSSLINKNALPLNLMTQNYWALLNLLLALATCLIGFLLIIFGILNKKEEDEDTKVKNKWKVRIISAIVGIISLIIFFLTENMNNPWIWVDQWTLLMILIFIINIILIFFTKHKKEEKE